jgi:hypothetical protein
MELAIVILLLALLAVTAAFGGADSRPGIDDEPRRAL